MEYAEDDYLMISGIQHFKFACGKGIAGQFQNDGSQWRMRYCRISEM